MVIRDSAGAQLFSGKIITGDSASTYSIQPLPAGAYTFACIVHPTMSGSLTVR